ncbi:transporter substrate-binding domain-containing protein [Psychrobium sp. MM17-31]|uniref:transporter substrate-binding domain-containing protein n=1 Tax=Psychrobium sp. MM17-31 TaxID=2917758 RepID=UPI001EF5C9CF|nr:transporter substrate-binding domain-containing protein [Psychrobium sp. MM17-31]MCG7531950.1 transporter substrate-binding domain-containing protein [Psychrobium sp. MM17-31]
MIILSNHLLFNDMDISSSSRLVLIIFLLASLQSVLAKDVVRFNKGTNTKNQTADKLIESRYPLRLLEIALQQTEQEFGDYKLVPSVAGYQRFRAMNFMDKGQKIDVMWGKESGFSKTKLVAIKIPIYRKSANYRLFVIRKADVSKFAKISTEKQLKAMRLGTTRHSPLGKELKKLDYTVVNTAQSTQHLRKMLKHNRFDYFSIPVSAAKEVTQSNPELMVVEHLAWQWSQTKYFFVHPDNQRLRDRITLGLQKAEQTGVFQTFFNNHPATAEYRLDNDNKQRHIIKLDINL